MSQARVDNLCNSAHLRVMLSSTENNMPPPFMDINNMHDIPPPEVDFSAPPPYEVAANSKLPTYEEVEREKQMEEQGPQLPPPNHATLAAYVTVEATEGVSEQLDPENGLLGTDIMFLTSFFVAFLFNWIGFLLLMCFCHTVASRYGALAGFGLSLAKWTLIVKHSTELASHENSWLWWLIMAFGIVICVRAVVQYLHIKRGWRLLSGTAQERLLFFY
ncbi:NEDD4 family-interacting protein 1 [Danaus plexippus]|uniref:NEDD4 family-interacting protein 1 n=2 Tax=Danaus TaxID=13036 RepID=A0A212ESW6_DANPL|nr:NEDD4 family-interacting protein 1 [Danaus plexippus]OWR44580.1 NEDD4 family-interacting protein 1 [Danaus plexippus plexippus]